MAYQTRTTRSAMRPGTGTQQSPGVQQPQIVFSSGNSAGASANQATGYVTTTVNQFSSMASQQQQQQQGQQVSVTTAALTDAISKVDTTDNEYEDLLDDNMKAEEDPSRPKWMKKRKEPAFKVSKKVRRKRMNAKLRRLLQPKNAIMVLNELKESVKFTFHEQSNAMQQNYFLVTVEVDGQTYQGQGLSKPTAKQSAAENALKALLLEKMAQSTPGLDGDSDVAMKEESTLELGPPGTDVPPGEEPPLLDEDGKPMGRQFAQQPEDDVPWGSLASFALYKLFNDWQSQGTTVPLGRTGTNTAEAAECGNGSPPLLSWSLDPKTGLPGQSRGPAPMKRLPDNPTERHPVMLLNQLRPSLIFNDINMQGVPPNVVFTMSVTVDGVAYQGMGKNKKEAKKEAAKSALASVFNIHYDN